MPHVSPSLVAETGTLATGVVTVSGAVSSPKYRTFAAALTDGDTVDVVLKDAQGDQASYPASTWDETAGALTLGSVDVSTGTITDGAVTVWAATDAEPEVIQIACSDETTALTAGTAKATFRMPFAMTLSAVRASVTTAPTGSVLTVDINEGGTSILSTKITIDATEKTSTTAATAAVISDTALADDAEITIDLDTVGSTVAGAGLKVSLIGTRA